MHGKLVLSLHSIFGKTLLHSLILLVIILSTVLLLAMQIDSSKPAKPVTNSPSINTQASPTFKDITLAAGITHSHLQNTGQVTDLIDSIHSGACVADFNNDGWQDLLFMAGGGQTRFYGRAAWWQGHSPIVLYQNKFGVFTKVAPPEVLSKGSTTACSTGDFNNDGLIDFIAATTEKTHLFINQDNFIFAEDSNFSKIAGTGWTSHISAADINNDGLLDVHLSKFLKYRQNLKNLELASGFTEQHHLQMDPGKFDGIENIVLVNQGLGKFVNETNLLGLNGNPERTLSSLWADINQDGLVDLIEHNLGDQAVRSYLQKEDGTFQEVIQANWGLRANNVHYSLIGKQIYDTKSRWFATRPSGLSSLFKPLDELNQDDSWQAGLVTHQRSYQSQWGSAMGDFNNDGYADIAMASGGKEPDVFSPQMTIPMTDMCASRHLSESRLTKTAFDVSACSTQRMMSSRSVLKFDYNNDGLLDLLFLSNNDFPQLLQNISTPNANWIGLDTAQAHTIEIVVGENTQPLNHYDNQALFGTHDARFHVGLGNAKNVLVRTLSETGKVIQENVLAANQYYRYDDLQWEAILVEPIPEKLQKNTPALTSKSGIALDSLIMHAVGKPKSPVWFEKVTNLLQAQTSLQISRLVAVINRYQEMDTLPLYLDLISHSNENLANAAAAAITRLENEYATSILLAKFDTNDTKQFCRIASIFTTWFDEEEAVNRSKGRAIPFLIRGLKHTNQEVVKCSALALATAEHINGAFAIIDVIDNVADIEQITLANSLGKIRQKIATEKLLNIFKDNPYASAKQQALIALTRLDYKLLNELISSNSSNPVVWLAIHTIADAQDGVVIPNTLQKHWLQGMSAGKLQDFVLPQNRGLFIQAVANRRIDASINSLNSVDEADKIHSSLAQALLLMDSIPNKTIAFLLSMDLDSKQLTELARILNQRESVAINGDTAIANLFAIFTYLNKAQKDALFSSIRPDTNLVLNDHVVFTFLNTCIENKLNLAQQERNTLLASFRNLLSACSVYEALSAGDNVEDKILQIQANYPKQSLGSIFDLVKMNTSQLSNSLMNQLSSTILYRSKVNSKVRHNWASWHMENDKVSRTWLSKQLESGNEAILTLLLDKHSKAIFDKPELLSSLLKDTRLHDEVKYRLAAFIHAQEVTKGRLQ